MFAARSREPNQAPFSHQRPDEPAIDDHVEVVEQTRPHASDTVGAAGSVMDVDDRVSHDQPPHFPVGRFLSWL